MILKLLRKNNLEEDIYDKGLTRDDVPNNIELDPQKFKTLTHWTKNPENLAKILYYSRLLSSKIDDEQAICFSTDEQVIRSINPQLYHFGLVFDTEKLLADMNSMNQDWQSGEQKYNKKGTSLYVKQFTAAFDKLNNIKGDQVQFEYIAKALDYNAAGKKYNRCFLKIQGYTWRQPIEISRRLYSDIKRQLDRIAKNYKKYYPQIAFTQKYDQFTHKYRQASTTASYNSYANAINVNYQEEIPNQTLEVQDKIYKNAKKTTLTISVNLSAQAKSRANAQAQGNTDAYVSKQDLDKFMGDRTTGKYDKVKYKYDSSLVTTATSPKDRDNNLPIYITTMGGDNYIQNTDKTTLDRTIFIGNYTPAFQGASTNDDDNMATNFIQKLNENEYRIVNKFDHEFFLKFSPDSIKKVLIPPVMVRDIIDEINAIDAEGLPAIRPAVIGNEQRKLYELIRNRDLILAALSNSGIELDPKAAKRKTPTKRDLEETSLVRAFRELLDSDVFDKLEVDDQ